MWTKSPRAAAPIRWWTGLDYSTGSEQGTRSQPYLGACSYEKRPQVEPPPFQVIRGERHPVNQSQIQTLLLRVWFSYGGVHAQKPPGS